MADAHVVIPARFRREPVKVGACRFPASFAFQVIVGVLAVLVLGVFIDVEYFRLGRDMPSGRAYSLVRAGNVVLVRYIRMWQVDGRRPAVEPSVFGAVAGIVLVARGGRFQVGGRDGIGVVQVLGHYGIAPDCHVAVFLAVAAVREHVVEDSVLAFDVVSGSVCLRPAEVLQDSPDAQVRGGVVGFSAALGIDRLPEAEFFCIGVGLPTA